MGESTTDIALDLAFSDMLFFQQPEIMYTLAVAAMTVGILFWLFGSEHHRLVFTVLALSIGVVVGWYLGNFYNANCLLTMMVGAVIGASAGYWLFRAWLGLLASLLMFLILLILYGSGLVVPSLKTAAQQSYDELERYGMPTSLPPPPTTRPADRATEPSILIPTAKTTAAQAYQNLKVLVPRLCPRQYANWQQWSASFGETFNATVQNLSRIMPHPKIDLVVMGAISILVGCILAALRPVFLNVVYTSVLGTLLIAGAIASLLALKQSGDTEWLVTNPWAIGSTIVLMILIGCVAQYYLYGGQEGEPQDAGENDAPAKGAKSKKK